MARFFFGGNMQQRVLLSNIPLEVQQKFGFPADTAEAIATSAVMGGSFSFRNKEGEIATVDGVELLGTGINIQEYE